MELEILIDSVENEIRSIVENGELSQAFIIIIYKFIIFFFHIILFLSCYI